MKATKKKMTEGFLLLEDGTSFRAWSFGADKEVEGELVFHTSFTGYPEILTDPSYCNQIVCFSSPQIGNQGIHADDFESSKVWASGMIVRDFWDAPQHWRKQKSLQDFLIENGIPGLTGVDTRRLVLKLRDEGAMQALLSPRVSNFEKRKKDWKPSQVMKGSSLVGRVSTPKAYRWTMGSVSLLDPNWERPAKSGGRAVLLDFGVKRQILRYLIDAGFEEVWVLPSESRLEDVEALSPDAVILSNGPGDPAAEQSIVSEVKKMIGRWPILGICLGHQLLAWATGYETEKLKFGHRAANHPVRLAGRNAVAITSQNHGFAVTGSMTYAESRHLNDGSLAGFIDPERKLLAYQFHPEASPGPLDTREIFRDFREGRCWS